MNCIFIVISISGCTLLGHCAIKYMKLGIIRYDKLQCESEKTLYQFVMKFWGPSVFGTVEDIRSDKICRFLTRC